MNWRLQLRNTPKGLITLGHYEGTEWDLETIMQLRVWGLPRHPYSTPLPLLVYSILYIENPGYKVRYLRQGVEFLKIQREDKLVFRTRKGPPPPTRAQAGQFAICIRSCSSCTAPILSPQHSTQTFFLHPACNASAGKV